ncbi:MAG: phosphatidylglycerophosphatase A [Cellvibrionaceae bacterium]|nr:phosphatidylglycerophosphatase A [Cellvibrionaceae bacterium]
MLPDFFTLLRHPTQLLALGFGSGLSPVAPGTFGTLAAIPLYLLLAQIPFWGQLLVIILACGGGIYLCGATANALGVHDHPAIVWDEFVGFWLTMLALPLVRQPLLWYWLVLGFVLFRVFDILKPWPIRWIDSGVKGGVGIMLDDVLAGIYAGVCLAIIILLYQHYSYVAP